MAMKSVLVQYILIIQHADLEKSGEKALAEKQQRDSYGKPDISTVDYCHNIFFLCCK